MVVRLKQTPIPSAQLGQLAKIGIARWWPIDTLLLDGRRLPLFMHADEALALVALSFEPSLTPSFLPQLICFRFRAKLKLKTGPLEHYDKNVKNSSIMVNERVSARKTRFACPIGTR